MRATAQFLNLQGTTTILCVLRAGVRAATDGTTKNNNYACDACVHTYVRTYVRRTRACSYLHSQALDARLASFLAEEPLFASQHFDPGALLLSPEHMQTVQTLFEMTRGVQFSDQTDEITEANNKGKGKGKGSSSSNNNGSSNNSNNNNNSYYQHRQNVGRDGEMLHIPIPPGLRAGDRLVHTMADGERIELRVPKGKKGGDTILCLYVPAPPACLPAAGVGVVWKLLLFGRPCQSSKSSCCCCCCCCVVVVSRCLLQRSMVLALSPPPPPRAVPQVHGQQEEEEEEEEEEEGEATRQWHRWWQQQQRRRRRWWWCRWRCWWHRFLGEPELEDDAREAHQRGAAVVQRKHPR